LLRVLVTKEWFGLGQLSSSPPSFLSLLLTKM